MNPSQGYVACSADIPSTQAFVVKVSCHERLQTSLTACGKATYGYLSIHSLVVVLTICAFLKVIGYMLCFCERAVLLKGIVHKGCCFTRRKRDLYLSALCPTRISTSSVSFSDNWTEIYNVYFLHGETSQTDRDSLPYTCIHECV